MAYLRTIRVNQICWWLRARSASREGEAWKTLDWREKRGESVLVLYSDYFLGGEDIGDDQTHVSVRTFMYVDELLVSLQKTQSYTIVHYLTLSYTILHYLTPSYTILHYLTLSYTILHYLTLFYTILHYLTLSYTILHSILHYLFLTVGWK